MIFFIYFFCTSKDCNVKALYFSLDLRIVFIFIFDYVNILLLHGIFKHFLSPKGNVGKRRDPRKLPQRGHSGLHSFLFSTIKSASKSFCCDTKKQMKLEFMNRKQNENEKW